MVDDRSSETIMQKLKESVQQNSIIHSDCWRGYNPVQSSFKAHQTVNHSKYFKDPEHVSLCEKKGYLMKIFIFYPSKFYF